MSNANQSVNITGSFTGQQAFSNFQAGMGANVSAVGKFATAISGAATVTNSFNTTMTATNGKIAVTVGQLQGSLATLSNAITSLSAAFHGNINIANSFNQTIHDTGNNVKITNGLIQAMAEKTNSFVLSWQSIGRLIHSQLIARYIQMTASGIDTAVMSAAEFNRQISLIRTISQDTNQTQADWRDTIRTLSDEMGSPIMETAVGTFDAISNQVARGAAATRFMAEAMQFARTTAATTAEGVNLLSSVINSYGVSAEEAGKLSAGLFSMIELGRVKVSEISNSFGPLAVSAKLLGVELNEVYASMAILTSQGTRSSVAITNISNVMQKLIKPTEGMKELFKEWKVSSGEAAIATFGFSGVIERLAREAERGGLSRLGEIASDLRAIRGTAGLTGGNVLGDFTTVKNMIDQSTEKYETAKKLMAESSGTQFQVELNKIKNILTVDLGQAALDFFVKFSKQIGGISTITRDFANALLTMGTSIIAVTAPAIQLLKFFDGWGLRLSSLLIIVGTSITALRFYSSTINALKTQKDALTAATAANAAAMTVWQKTLIQVNPWIAGISLAVTVLAGLYSLLALSETNAAQASVEAEAKRKAAIEESHKKAIAVIQQRQEAEKKALSEQLRQTNLYISTVLGAWDAVMEKQLTAKKDMEKDVEALEKILEKMNRDVQESVINQTRDTLRMGLNLAADNVVGQIQAVQSAAIKLRFEVEGALFNNKFEFARKLFEEFETQINAAQERIDKALQKSMDNQKETLRKFEERKFNLSLEAMSPTDAKVAMEKRIQDLIAAAKANPLDVDAAKGLTEAQRLAERLTDKQKDSNKKKGTKTPLDLTQEQNVVTAMNDLEKARQAALQNQQTSLDAEKAKMNEQILRDTLQEQLDLRKGQLDTVKKMLEYQTSLREAEKTVIEDLHKQENDHKAAVTDVMVGAGGLLSAQKKLGNPGYVPGTRLTVHFADNQKREQQLKTMLEGFRTGSVTASSLQGWSSMQSMNLMQSLINTKGLSADQTDNIKKAIEEYDALTIKLEKLQAEEKKLTNAKGQAETVKQNLGAIQKALSEAKKEWPEIYKDITEQAAKPLETVGDRLLRLHNETLKMSQKFFPEAPLKPLNLEGLPGAANIQIGPAVGVGAGAGFQAVGPFGQGAAAPGFASGGLVDGPNGFDSIHARLTRKEFVTPANMTARYYPVLQSIREGSYPVHNYGNRTYSMTFNVKGSENPNNTVRHIGKALKRAIQRGQINLG